MPEDKEKTYIDTACGVCGAMPGLAGQVTATGRRYAPECVVGIPGTDDYRPMTRAEHPPYEERPEAFDPAKAQTATNAEEAAALAQAWADGRRSWVNTVYYITERDRQLEVVAVMDAQEVVKWAALAQMFHGLESGDKPQEEAALLAGMDAAREWNVCDPPTEIPADAVVAIVTAALAAA